MSKINVDTWEPESGTAATLMASGDTVTLPDGAILAVASGGDINVASGGEIDIASGATLDVNGTIDLTGATKTGFPTGGFLGLVVYTADGTYTPGGTTNGTAGDEGSATVSKIIVEVISAGGGSGSNSASATSGGSGGGGAYALKTLDIGTDRAVITTCTATVGAAGAAASYVSAQPGATGGVSSFAKTTGSGSFTTVTNAGGLGGSNNTSVPGGFTAVPTTGDINLAGQAGHRGDGAGDTKYGWGGRGNPSSGTGYGSGGTCNTGSYTNGVVGLNGIIVIWEYA